MITKKQKRIGSYTILRNFLVSRWFHSDLLITMLRNVWKRNEWIRKKWITKWLRWKGNFWNCSAMTGAYRRVLQSWKAISLNILIRRRFVGHVVLPRKWAMVETVLFHAFDTLLFLIKVYKNGQPFSLSQQ